MNFPDNIRYIEYVFGWDNDETHIRLLKYLDADHNTVVNYDLDVEDFLYENVCYRKGSGMIDVVTKHQLNMIHKFEEYASTEYDDEGGYYDTMEWGWV